MQGLAVSPYFIKKQGRKNESIRQASHDFSILNPPGIHLTLTVKKEIPENIPYAELMIFVIVNTVRKCRFE